MKLPSRHTLSVALTAFVVGASSAACIGFVALKPYVTQFRTYVIGQRALNDAKETVTNLYYLRHTDVPGVMYRLENQLDSDIVALVAYSSTGDGKPLDARFPEVIRYVRTYRQEHPSIRTEPEIVSAVQAFLSATSPPNNALKSDARETRAP